MADVMTAHESFDITGMTCAACSARVTKVTEALPGVSEARVNLLKNTMDISFDGASTTIEAIVSAVDAAGYGAIPRSTHAASGTETAAATAQAGGAAEKVAREKRMQLIISAIATIPLFYLAMGPMLHLPEVPGLAGMEGMMANALTQLLLCTVIIVANRHYFVTGIRALVSRAPNMDSLVAIGAAASVVYSIVGIYRMAFALGAMDLQTAHVAYHDLYFDSAGMILTLVTLGKYFEARAKGKTTDAISALIDLTPKTATVVRHGIESEIPAADVVVGDMVVVRAGEQVPADGIVREGSAAIDESAITGEPVPREIAPGALVTGATVSTSGWFVMEVKAVGDDTTLAGIIRLIDEATSSKAPIERQADRIASIFVPAVIAIAAVTLAVWLVVGNGVSTALGHAISVLVISCPCALGLATPTAIMVGTGRGAAEGILVKDAESLETASTVRTVVFDKTGTITTGSPQVTSVTLAHGVIDIDLLWAAAALERKSEHPLATALCAYADEMAPGIADDAVIDNFAQVPGGGLTASINGSKVAVGNARLMDMCKIDIRELTASADELSAKAQTPLFVAADHRVLGVVGIADVVKTTSVDAIARLHDMGIRTVLLTGDGRATAHAVAEEIGVDTVISDVLPADKEAMVRELQEGGVGVAMVGDGINDAPALARADVGLAIGAGTDIAIGSANIVLMRSDPADVATAIELSRATMRNIKQNLFWALVYNAVCIPVAAGMFTPLGISLNPMIAAAAMGFSSLFVVSNALRLRTWKPKRTPSGPRSAAQRDGVERAASTSQVEVTAQEKSGTDMKTKTFNIEGMMCDHCVAHVKKALEDAGAKDVQVSLDAGTATLSAGPFTSDAKLIDAVADAGYAAKRA